MNGEIYSGSDRIEALLGIDKILTVELRSRKKDTLIKKYRIFRKRAVPDVKISINSNVKQIISFTEQPAELELPPDERISIITDAQPGLESPDVEYRLKNMKTGKAEYINNRLGLGAFILEEGVDYEFQINYAAQAENVGVIYLKAKANWYRSPLIYILVIAVLSALSIIFIVARFKKRLKSSEESQQKMEADALRLQSLLNPHFTFNALSTIQGLMNTGRITEANDYLQDFSLLLRTTLGNSQQVFNSLDKELDMLRTYIRLEAIRFNFTWSIEIPENFNQSAIEIPTLLLQPLVENSIKHGISGLGHDGQLQIICKEGQERNTFIIIVKDNGQWIDKASNSGYGLTLTRKRISTINKMKQDQSIVLEFHKGAGTEAVIIFYNWLNN